MNDLKYVEEERTKKAFHASDVFKSDLDLYFAFIGEPKTNKPNWQDTLKWGAGNGVEAQMMKILKMNGKVNPDYDQKEHGRIEIEREGIKIHGYIDAKLVTGEPVEIKSINNKNTNDISSYENGYPRENYVGQLSIYMDALDSYTGTLFVASIDGLNTFFFPCKRIKERVYKCGNVKIDLNEEYKRWSNLYHNHVVPKIIPDIWQYTYKYPVDKIDWYQQPDSVISKARNGHKVVGDWQITFSPWKDKIIEMQGTVPGYTNEELRYIQAATEGYTTWPKRNKKTGVRPENML